jgi:hypothetical protein
MDAADERMILESAFAAELARQLTAAADAVAGRSKSARSHGRRRRWLLLAAVAAVSCVAVLLGVALPGSRGGRENGAGFVPSASSGQLGAPEKRTPVAGLPAPIPFGDELSELTSGAAGHVWAWGTTYGTDKDHPGGPLLEVWDGQGWSRVTAPGKEIAGVAEPATGDLWAGVSMYRPRGPRLANWDGSRWRFYPAMDFVWTSEVSGALLAFSPNDVWAVGWASLDPRFFPSPATRRKPWLLNHLMALHFDGSRWRSVAMPALGRGEGEASLRLLRGGSPGSIWALGSYTQFRRKLVEDKRQWVVVNEGGQLLLHWDGRRWSREPLPADQLATGRRDRFALDDMTVAPDGALWCSGRRWFGPDNTGDLFVPVVLRLKDGHWRIMASSATATPPGDWRDVMLSSISLTSEDDVWVSGRTEPNGDGSVLWHWDGSAWSTTVLDTTQLPGKSNVSRVLALGPGDVWALCNGSTPVDDYRERLQPSFLHYDGSAWRPVMAAPSPAEP